MSDHVRAKKHLGQHFLRDLGIAKDIAELVPATATPQPVLEIGPGTGVLTQFLLQRPELDLQVAEIDTDSVGYLKKHYPALKGRILVGDVLELDWATKFAPNLAVVGNFPYNISSQIMFKVLDHRQQVTSVVCMLQREVAQRIASPPGNRDYGILSVFLQAYYDIKYCFTVDEHVFDPPPKVKSGVIILTRNRNQELGCNEKLFTLVVKTGFNQRRKTLRNALKPLSLPQEIMDLPLMDLRAERLHYTEYVDLCLKIEQARASLRNEP